MKPTVIPFPTAHGAAANDEPPSGPGGTSVSVTALRRCTRMIRTLRGVTLRAGARGQAMAA